MNIKKIANIALEFTINKLIEILGITVLSIGILLFTALISYSPEDPNFIFPENTEIKNILGFQGSYVSDLFFQSIGFISYLVPVTFFFTGINIFRTKDFFLLIENTFFIILYLIFGSLYFGHFYKATFTLYINGSGGFIGNYLDNSFLKDLVNINENITYYILALLIISLFLISINFSLKKTWNFLKQIFNLVNKDKNKNYTDKSEIINEYMPQDEIKNLIQEDLPFIKADKLKENEKKNLDYQI